MKIFIDNDIILDILLERTEYAYSAKVLEYIEKGVVRGFTSPIIFTNTFYIVSKAKDKKNAWDALRKLRILFRITRLNEKTIDKALASGFTDFEDAIQYYSALEAKLDYLVTRNKNDYRGKEVKIVSPKEIIAILTEN